jgi:uroporphyrinogen decarboxylase
VRAVFDRVGEILLSWYKQLVGLDRLVGFFQGDDMGFKTATLLPPDFLREHVLPHHRRLAELAHDHDLLYFLHACGNLDSITPDLIDDVGVDGKHSFEDEIEPVTVFQQKYGDKVTPLGGIDVDRLCRANEADLREHVAKVLDNCMPKGPYALGSGNTVTNYVRIENYLAMLDEGLAWANR